MTTTPAPAPLLWSPAEAAARLGLRSRSAVYDLINAGELRSLKIGARRLIPDDELRRFIRARLAAEQAEDAGW